MWRSVRAAIWKVADEFKPDCILSYWLHPDGEVAVRTAQSLGIPSAIIVGGSDARLLPSNPSRRCRIAQVLSGTDVLIPVSQGLRSALIGLGASGEKVHAVYQGIDVDRFVPGSKSEARRRLELSLDRRILLWVGRMVPVKGLEILIEASDILKKSGHEHQLHLVGDGPLRNSITAKVSDRGLNQWIKFVGSVLPDRLPDWYRAADLTVLSSWSEGIPNVLRESLACGTPFVSTNVGDIAEFSPETASQLVPPGDPLALANAIARMLEGQTRRPALARPASWNDYADSIAGLLDNLPIVDQSSESKNRTTQLMTSATHRGEVPSDSQLD